MPPEKFREIYNFAFGWAKEKVPNHFLFSEHLFHVILVGSQNAMFYKMLIH